MTRLEVMYTCLLYTSGKGNRAEWTVVSTDKKKAVGLIMQKHVIPNTQYACYRAKGLDEAKKYHFYNRKLQYDIKEFGELVNIDVYKRQGLSKFSYN